MRCGKIGGPEMILKELNFRGTINKNHNKDINSEGDVKIIINFAPYSFGDCVVYVNGKWELI